eukprot:CAMPEP_0194248298 /NCGR_PEP_ID=MMETSP0158-20130606/18032_1 /TAXON_ID=33649 /ORGANISM="Thalassionema nitzschioides, Strain L26-B" /LENGTH=369 /DNA_ID=CAMNT_0038984563 /DNA_START=19 /DNA_END=1128 /DNA_ORIENTATION=-
MKIAIALVLLATSPATTLASVRGNNRGTRQLKKGSGSKKEKGSKKGGVGKKGSGKKGSGGDDDDDDGSEDAIVFSTRKPPAGDNICDGAGDPRIPDVPCFDADGLAVGGQSGANVTKGYTGGLGADHDPLTVPYYVAGLCPVNVHWHLGTEHLSIGQYDEVGTGPTEIAHRRKLAGKEREGYQCHHYDESDPIYTTPYNWQHCVDMEVGQTYEVHWPHSSVGACGTPNQYQSPFYDGVLCNAGNLSPDLGLHEEVGVQAQIFTIVNDEDYFYPDLISGMVVDGEMGSDMAYYTGSTTGTGRNNEICSQYTPITWQVDRTCHLISASAFDKMCADMLSMRDDMSSDLYPHGSRELVDHDLTHDNHQTGRS